MNRFAVDTPSRFRFSLFTQLVCLSLLTLGGSLTTTKAANLGLANDFNGFIFGNVQSSGGHSEGAIAVGGNWTGNGYEVNQHARSLTLPGAPNTGLYMAGNVQTSNFLRVLHGNAYYGGTNNGTLSANNGTISQGINNNIFLEAQSYLGSLSSQLASYNSVTLPTSDPNNINVNLAANTLNGNLKIYNVQATELMNLKTLSFNNSTSSDTVVINVFGTNVNWAWQTNAGALTNNKILWNFVDATTLNIGQREFGGSILAMNATVNQTQNINGTLIAKDLNVFNSVQLHQFTFTGNLPAVVPEPSSMIMVLVGGLFLTRRQRPKRKAA